MNNPLLIITKKDNNNNYTTYFFIKINKNNYNYKNKNNFATDLLQYIKY